MPALNIAANQILPKPVTSFLQGKAMRLAQENQRIANEAAQAELDYIPEQQDRARASDARAERGVAVEEENANLRREDLELRKKIALLKLEGEQPGRLADLVKDGREAIRSGNIEAIDLLSRDMGMGAFEPEALPLLQSLVGSEETDDDATSGMRDAAEAIRIVGDKSLSETERAAALKALGAYVAPEEGEGPTSGMREAEEALKILRDPSLSATEKASQLKALDAYVPPSTPSARQIKVDSLIKQGVDSERASNLVDGFEDIEVLDSGQVRHVDTISGKVTELPISSLTGVVSGAPAPGHTLWDFAVHGTGLASTLKAVASVPIAWLGRPPPEVTIAARQSLKTEVNMLIRALSINPRFPVGEINRIKEEVKLEPSLWDDPILMHTRMISIDESLRGRAQRYEDDAGDPNLSVELKKDRRTAASDIRNFLSVLGVKEGLPPGSAFVGLTDDNLPIYKLPDGSGMVLEP